MSSRNASNQALARALRLSIWPASMSSNLLTPELSSAGTCGRYPQSILELLDLDQGRHAQRKVTRRGGRILRKRAQFRHIRETDLGRW
jgi:hypothetical protein